MYPSVKCKRMMSNNKEFIQCTVINTGFCLNYPLGICHTSHIIDAKTKIRIAFLAL